MDTLVAVNIKLYQERHQKKTLKPPRITHEFYFLNIIALAQLMGHADIAELIGTSCLLRQRSITLPRLHAHRIITHAALSDAEDYGGLSSDHLLHITH